jgi:hypothetical protein
MEGPTVGTKPSARGTLVDRFSYKTHVDLSSHLTEGCTFSLTKELTDANI